MIADEVILLKRTTSAVMAAGLILTILISNAGSIIQDGRRLDGLRGRVLRLHILANSDSEEDQHLKLLVRDELLRRGYFSGAADLSEAEAIVQAAPAETAAQGVTAAPAETAAQGVAPAETAAQGVVQSSGAAGSMAGAGGSSDGVLFVEAFPGN